MTQVVKNRKSTKVVKIISRTEFKNDPRKVCYQVRSSDGVGQYTTCLFNGKATSCTCKASSKCYHMTQLEVIEAGRKAVEQVQAARVASAQDWTPVSEPKTEKDANLQAEWGSPVYDEAHYTAKFARADAMNAAYNRQLTPIQCKDGLYVPEVDEYEVWKKANGLEGYVSREQYSELFDPCGLDLL